MKPKSLRQKAKEMCRMLPVRRAEQIHKSPKDYDRQHNTAAIQESLFEEDEEDEMDKSRYIEDRLCPYCGEEIEPLDLEDPYYISEEDHAWSMQTGCPVCGHEWVDIFTLTDVKEIRRDEYIGDGPTPYLHFKRRGNKKER